MNSDLFDGPAPPSARNTKQVIRVTTQDKVHFIALSRKVYTCWIHWRGRSIRCPGEDTCDLCKNGVGKKWKGYIDVLHEHPPVYNAFLEITPVVGDMLKKLVDPLKGLRGLRFSVCKTKGGPKGRYLIDAMDRYANVENLQEEDSPLPLLEKLWSINARKLNGTPKPD